MDPEELASLAASIEAHGLRDPIIIGRVNGTKSEMLVDGRNRLRACEIAGVEPRFETIEFENDDAVKAFVADKSEHRNLTKGQQAMRMALLYPEPDKRGRGNKGKAAETADFSQRRLPEARAVLAYSRELALAVRDGTKKLDEALAEVKAARDSLWSEEGMIARLRAEAPDLADLVAEERMKLNEAVAALDERELALTRIREGGKVAAKRLSEFCTLVACIQQAHDAGERDLIAPEIVEQITESVEVLKRMESSE